MKKTVTVVKALVFTFAIGVSPSSLVYSQNNSRQESSAENLPKIVNTSALGTFYSDFSNYNISSGDLETNLRKWLGCQSNDTFKIVKTWADDLGIKKTVYQHFYKDIKVQDDIIVIHEKDGKVIYVNGEFVKNIDISVVTAPIAPNELKNIIAAASKNSPEKITLSPAENVISKTDAPTGLKINSSTMVSASSMVAPVFSKTYNIDNSTKQVVNEMSLIHNTDTPSVSTTYYKGNQNMTVDSYNGSYRLKDNARKVWTLDGTNLGSAGGYGLDSQGYVLPASGPVEYSSSTANFTAASTKAPVEIHWAIQKANDFYSTVFNRSSFDGNGTAIANYYNVDFSIFNQPGQANPTPSGYGANATAITFGTSTGGQVHFMAYGNGNLPSSPGAFNPFAGIDVGGHEYSHLVVATNGTGGLNYQGESGAINESFADILGTSIEFYAAPSQANWTIGEGLCNFAPGYLRNMAAPKTGPAALSSQQPDTYNGTYWQSTAAGAADYGGVHTNSGVGNKWFYLLSAGGTGTNDNGTAYNVTGITIQKAEKIAFKTLTGGYLTSNATYSSLYNASKQAAIALYGTASNELQQVENAWCAVGLGNCANLLAVNESTKSDAQNISVYPNPVKNGLFTIDNNNKYEAAFEIYDVSGKLIRQTEKLSRGTNKINISGTQKGIYIIKISFNGTAVSKKIVVE